MEVQDIQAIANICQSIGLLVAGVAAWIYWRQSKANRTAADAAVLQDIATLLDNVNGTFSKDDTQHQEDYELVFDEYPDIGVFRKDQRFHPVTKEDEWKKGKEVRAYYLAVRWLDLFDMVFSVKDALPGPYFKTWNDFILDCLTRSKVMRQIILKPGKPWYCETMLDLARQADKAAPEERRVGTKPA